MDISIDLGSTRTRVFVPGKGKVCDEASVITHDEDTGAVYEVGDRAYRMIGKTPVGMQAVYPLENGVVAHSDLADALVTILLKEVCAVKITMPKIVASIPCELTEVEKMAIVSAVSAFGARKVFLIEAPKAAAMGCGIDISSPHGVFVADLGGGTADAAVLSLGGISACRSVRRAGMAMDEEIVKYIRKKYNLIIGMNMAQECKRAIGCVAVPDEPEVFRVKGRDAVTGMPRYADVGSAEIKEPIEEIALEIVAAIRDVLEQTPPELIGDIHSDGIILTGGLAKLKGFAKLISKATKLRVRVHKQAQDCVIMGCGKATASIPEAERGVAKRGISPLLTAY